MTRAEILDRSPVEILLDHRRAYVRRTRDRGRIGELVGHLAHHRGDLPLRVRRGGRLAALRQLDRGGQRPAPGAEVLRGELRAEVPADVRVQLALVEVAAASLFELVLKKPRPGEGEQILHRSCELCIDDRAADHDVVLAAVAKGDARPTHADMALPQRRDPERARGLGVPLGTDAEPAEVDQPHRDRRDLLLRQAVERHVLGHRLAQRGKALGKTDQLVVLRLLLLRAEISVVEVLLPPRRVDSGRLQLRFRTWRDPDVLPGGRNRKRLDSLQLYRVRDLAPVGVDIAKTAFRPLPAPANAARHGAPLPRTGPKLILAADGFTWNCRARGRPDGAGAARGVASRSRSRGNRARDRAPAVRPFAREPACDR